MSISFAGFRNGFPFPIRTRDKLNNPIAMWDGTTRYLGIPSASASSWVETLGPGTFYPVGFTLNEMAELYWRLRKLKFSGSLTASLSYASLPTDPPYFEQSEYDLIETGDFSGYCVSVSDPKVEANLCGPSGRLLELYSGSMDLAEMSIVATSNYRVRIYDDEAEAYGPWEADPPIVTPFDVSSISAVGSRVGMTYEPPFSSAFISVFLFEGLYYPAIQFYFDYVGSLVATVGVSTIYGDPAADYEESPITLLFLGKSIPLYSTFMKRLEEEAALTPTYYPPYSTDYAVSGSLVVEPAEYWPYGGKWNTTTGAPV